MEPVRAAKRRRTQGVTRAAAGSQDRRGSLAGSVVLRVSGAAPEGAFLGSESGVSGLREPSTPFRFDAAEHAYYVDGVRLPSITQMLESAGWTDSRWFTEESCQRGTQVHSLTADYDLGALDVGSCVSRYRGYLLSHVAAMGVVKPDILAVEEPAISSLGFGGRPDRVIRAWGIVSILEGKSGGPEKAHSVQTALQSILVASTYHLPPEALSRLCLYWKPTGKYKLEEHTDPRDFGEAYRIIAAYARGRIAV